LVELQRTILKQVAPLLRPGGHLLYSVCTFTAAETDATAHNFLASHPDFVQEDFRSLLPQEWQELTTDTGSVRTLPHHHDGMDAFFAVRFIKR
jgi:16S rRNA (cytosine967-C5)-methyltransferase